MSTSPGAKRQRTEDAPITRSIWHSDGSVVLQAERTQFRVHWSVLALDSSVFRDLQGLPQPPDQPSIDGCPVVEVSDDAADVEYLLKALYTPTFLAQKMLPLQAVGALIRLGRKYQFKDLLDSVVGRLIRENPTTLEEYDATKAKSTESIEPYRAIWFDMVSLASENNILAALPCAYFRLASTFEPAALFEGIERPDGTMASLSLGDLRRCVAGREKLITKQYTAGYQLGCMHHWKSSRCVKTASCHAWREELLTALMGRAIIAFRAPCFGSGFCPLCTQYTRESFETGRKKMWKDLPGFFDLPPWDQLKNDL
ncbi:hypothetical protein DFH06DRAFT_991924 [Mycena polygramma]|nr:hypothetical protein DFH06DRAFT_991924 [Mycena polygramma]